MKAFSQYDRLTSSLAVFKPEARAFAFQVLHASWASWITSKGSSESQENRSPLIDVHCDRTDSYYGNAGVLR